MTAKYIVLSLTLFSLLAGCGKVQVSQDFSSSFDFENDTTFGWNENLQKRNIESLKNNELLENRFRNGIENNLKLKGFQPNELPGMLVSYNYTVTSKLDTKTATAGFGIGTGRYGRHGTIGVNTGTSIHQYDQGKLEISIHSAATNQLIWIGTGTRETYTHSTPEKITREVNEIVEAVLEQFPPDKSPPR